MRAASWAYAIILYCLSASAQAAGIQLLNSDPGLMGAIWYPCASEPKEVPLGNLAVSADFGLRGVKDCPDHRREAASGHLLPRPRRLVRPTS